jgi:tetratricopeptide (TPR) repeat protein
VRPPPEDLLRQANELRAARRWKEAARAYERVIALHPGTPEAYAAGVAAADLHLEQLGDPRGACRLYRSALARSAQGPLGEQALWGSARCAAALGDRDSERKALQDYLGRYPSGLFEAAARTRLAELDRAGQ